MAEAKSLGARLLLEHMRQNGLSITRFAARAGLDRVRLQRLLKGKPVRVSVEWALAIQEASDGDVPWNSWTQHDEAEKEAS